MAKDGIGEKMKSIILQNEIPELGTISFIFYIILILMQCKIVGRLLKIEKKEILKIFIYQALTCLSMIIILGDILGIIASIVIMTLIYKRVFKFTLVKTLVAESISVFLFTLLEIINIKICEEFSSSILILIAELIIFLAHLSVYNLIKRKKIHISIEEVLNNDIEIKINKKLVCFIILIVLYKILVAQALTEIPTEIYLLGMILLLAYFFNVMRNIVKSLELEVDKNIILNLTGANERLRQSFDNMSSFRHDFKNILHGMGGCIVASDIKGLEKIYQDVICEYQEIKENIDLDKNLEKLPAIYNLINTKYIKAIDCGIDIKVDVYVDLGLLKIKQYELCRILGILIDNAIEACMDCKEKTITIKFLKDRYNNRNLVVIENTCKNYLVDLKSLKSKGFTTKKNKAFHGLGLWRVNQIIKKNENLRLYTTRDKVFKQQLEIYNWD